MALFVNPLTPRVKPWMIQSFRTFHSMDRTLKCDHCWKAVEQYFTAVLFVNPLTPRVKPWMIQSFRTFHSMDRTLKCDHSLESSTLLWYSLHFNFAQFVTLDNFLTLDLVLQLSSTLMWCCMCFNLNFWTIYQFLALSGLKGLRQMTPIRENDKGNNLVMYLP